MAGEVVIRGLADFQAQLRKAMLAEPKAMAGINKTIGKQVAAQARLFAVGEGAQQAHFARFIAGYGTQKGASVGLRGNTANAAFWGAIRHTGWYTNKDGPPQFKRWVGNSWEAGAAGQGPYAINPAVVHETDNIIRSYGEMIDHISRKAFPDN